MNKNNIKNIDLSFFSDYIDTSGYYSYVLNEDYYRLLTYLSKSLPDNSYIIDAGTCNGHSAIALAQNKNVKVESYDILDKKFNFGIDNIEFIKLDVLKISNEKLNRCDLIFLDIDPHDGKSEALFINRLIEAGFQGILVCDDIKLNFGMKAFWEKLCTIVSSSDITYIGHNSGTGISYFGKRKYNILEN